MIIILRFIKKIIKLIEFLEFLYGNFFEKPYNFNKYKKLYLIIILKFLIYEYVFINNNNQIYKRLI